MSSHFTSNAFKTWSPVCLLVHRSLYLLFVWELWLLAPPMSQSWLETRPDQGDQLTEFRDLEVLWIGEDFCLVGWFHSTAIQRHAPGHRECLLSLCYWSLQWATGLKASATTDGKRKKKKSWPASFWLIRANPFHCECPQAGVAEWMERAHPYVFRKGGS